MFPWPVSQEADPVRVEAPYCRQCGDPFPSMKGFAGEFTCDHCLTRKWHFAWARAGYRTEGQVREAVIGYKYNDQYYQEGQLVDWLVETFKRHAGGERWDGLVPVPLYRLRQRERGFNQAREIARGLSSRCQIPVSNCLYRYRETVSQAKLNRNARWENMAGAFRMKRRFDVRGQNLLIIDDVFTTGATVNACAQVLEKAGAARVAVLTIARS